MSAFFPRDSSAIERRKSAIQRLRDTSASVMHERRLANAWIVFKDCFSDVGIAMQTVW